MSGGFGKRSIASLLAIGVLAVSAFTVVGSGALASGTGSAKAPTVEATAPRAAEATAAKPRWQVLSGVKLTESNPAPRQLGWASGRVWAGFDAARKFDDGFLTLVSLRAAGRALTSAVKSEMVRVRGPFLITGSGLLYHTSGSVNGRVVSDAELRTARLLANGRLGAPREVPEEPEKRPPQEYHPGVVETIDVGGRTVWLLGGVEFDDRGNVKRIFRWICCSKTDELVDLSHLVRNTKDVHSDSLGLDTKGRLWLAWSNPVRMVELDPITLRSALCAIRRSGHSGQVRIRLRRRVPGRRERSRQHLHLVGRRAQMDEDLSLVEDDQGPHGQGMENGLRPAVLAEPPCRLLPRRRSPSRLLHQRPRPQDGGPRDHGPPRRRARVAGPKRGLARSTGRLQPAEQREVRAVPPRRRDLRARRPRRLGDVHGAGPKPCHRRLRAAGEIDGESLPALRRSS